MSRLDLNLLPQLRALLEQRNVTRAADELHMSQPALSAALAKLRRFYGDELLVRAGRGFELTPLAQAILPLVEEALRQTDRVATIASGFDPATSDREFVIAASDFVAAFLATPLRRLIAEEAPGVSLVVVPTENNDLLRTDSGHWDLVVGPVGYGFHGARKNVFRESFVAVVDSDNPIASQPVVRLADLARLPRAVSRFGTDVQTPADRFWAQHDAPADPAVSVTGILALLLLVEGSDLVALVPELVASRLGASLNVTTFQLPVEIEPVLVEAMFWSPGRTDDPANAWLRSVVQKAAARMHSPRAVDLVPRRVTLG